MNENQPQELVDLQEKLSEIFWYVKSQAKLARHTLTLVSESSLGDLDETERRVHKQLQELGQQLLEHYLKDLHYGDLGYRLTVDRQEYKRSHRQRPHSILSIFGAIPYEQSVYYNSSGTSVRPLAMMANLPERESTYFAQEAMSRLGIEDTFRESQDFYADFFGHSLSPRTIEGVIGDMEASYPDHENEKALPKPATEEKIGVVSFDGKALPVVKSEQTTGKTREALAGCVYTVAAKERTAEKIAHSLVLSKKSSGDKEEKAKPNGAQNIEYYASVTQPKKEVFRSVRKRAQQRFASCSITTTVCLLDGATCLWRLAKEYFPTAIYILDIIHVLDYLWKAAKALKEDQDDARDLVHTYLIAILKGRVSGVITGLRIRLAKNKISEKRREEVEAAIKYFENHRDYMQYDAYLSAGYPIATGVIESACGHLIKDRMCKAGAKWRMDGAESVLKLRCIKASRDWRKFHKIRKRSEKKRLYPHPLEKAA